MVKSRHLIGCCVVRNPRILDLYGSPCERLWTGKLKNVNKQMLLQERKIEWEQTAQTKTKKQKWIHTKVTSEPNGSEYFERIGNHANVCSCQNLTVTCTHNNRMHAKPPVSFTVLSMANFHFRVWIKKIQHNLKAFTGRDPCNNWTLGLQCKWHSTFEKFRNFLNWQWRKPLHSVQNVFACIPKHYLQYRERMEKQPFGIFTGPIRSRAQKFLLYGNLRHFSWMR